MKKNKLLILFLIIFLDLLGIGIMIPVLAPLFLDPSSAVIPAEWTESTRNIAFGILVAAYPLAQFFGAPILGTLSDQHGRKKVLLGSLLGTAIGYALFAVGIFTHQLWLLFVSRLLDGFTGGNIGVANSAIADMSTPETRTKNFGLVGMAFGLGFVVGPAVGGLLSDSSILPWFNASTPFWFATALSSLNLIFVALFFTETIKKKSIKKIHPFIGFTHLIKAWKMKKLRAIFIVAFLHALGFCFFTQFFPVFLVQKFSLGEASIGIFFAYIGIWIAFSQGFVARIASRFLSPENAMRIGLFGLGAILFAFTLPTQIAILYLIQPIMAIFEGLAFPNSTTLISHLANENDQGEAMGITQSLRALGQAIPPLIAGFLVNISQNLPTYTASALILLAWGIFMISFRPKAIQS